MVTTASIPEGDLAISGPTGFFVVDLIKLNLSPADAKKIEDAIQSAVAGELAKLVAPALGGSGGTSGGGSFMGLHAI